MEEAVRLREVTQKYPSPIIHLATGQLQKHRQNNTRKTENSQVEINMSLEGDHLPLPSNERCFY